jgi:hypothetical protein
MARTKFDIYVFISTLCNRSTPSNHQLINHVDDVMVSVLALSAVYRGFEAWSGKTKDYEIGICSFSVKDRRLRSKSKDWLARNEYNVSE